MKVTKLVREYIEDTVNAKFQPAIDVLNFKLDCVQKQFDEEKKNVEENITAYAKDMFKKHMFCWYKEEDANTLMNDFKVRLPHLYGIKAVLDDDDAIEKIVNLRKQREKTIKDILIELELGGTKADLDRLLSEIKVGEEV